MKTLLFLLFGIGALAQPIRLIVRGDDMGFSHSANVALIKSHSQGIETSIEVLAPSPWFPEAVKLLAQNPSVDVGIHLALTSEWDNVKWRPLTSGKSFCDTDGYLLPKIYPDAAYPKLAVLEKNLDLTEIEAEFRAQIEMVKKYCPRASHISGHMNCTRMNPEVEALTRKLAKEYGLLNDISDSDVEYVGYSGASKTPAEKIAAFKKTVENLKPGKTYMFLDHPALDDQEMRAIHHIGYENVAQDRQGVTDLFTDKSVMELLRKRNVQLINYSDLR